MKSTRKILFIYFLIVIFYGCKVDEIKINPKADFSFSPTDSIRILNLVEFTNNSENATSYLWDFGDGATSTQKNPVHAFVSVGAYNVRLIASFDKESDTISKILNIRPKEKIIYVTGYIGYGDLALGALIWENSICTLLSYQSASKQATNITFQGNDKYIVGFFNGSYYSKNDNYVNLISYDGNGVQYYTMTNGIAISNGDVYVSGNYLGDACYWKNQTQHNLSYRDDYATNIYVRDTDVYVSGNSGLEVVNNTWTENQYAVYWKNKIKTLLGIGRTFDIAVTNNDVYVVGSNNNKAVFWKNGTQMELPEGIVAKSIQISEQDVYIVGNNSNSAICWKNGTAMYLTYQDYITEATSVFVDGKDVYVAGMISKTGLNHKAVYWKNGKCVVLPFNDSNYSSTDIYVK